MIVRSFENTPIETVAADDGASAMRAMQETEFDAMLLDIELPDFSGLEAFRKFREIDAKLPIIFITAGGTSDTAIEAMKLGAFDYVLKPLDLTQLHGLIQKALDIRRLMKVRVAVSDSLSPEDQGDQIVGRSEKMQQVFKAIGRVAPQNVTALIRGESGTGKELVARAIYQHSLRAGAPFLAVNCAAIPEHLLESELFGHEKGAFTGADRTRIGKFEQCTGGTIFLDEVGDMPAPLQSKMLRVVQQQTFQRVGGNTTIRADVRLIAATNRNLEEMVEDGDFREDLLYRLNGYTIDLPPLRERDGDLILLLQHFLARIGGEVGKPIENITPEALEILKAYDWPGNVRELEGVIRQTLLQTSGTVITPEFLPLGLQSRPTSPARSAPQPVNDDRECDLERFISSRLANRTTNLYAETLEHMERYLLERVLNLANGNQSQASRILGITRGSLRHKIRTYGIKIEHVVAATIS
jgi:two-component system nitrogen regulation response regulator GlnG